MPPAKNTRAAAGDVASEELISAHRFLLQTSEPDDVLCEWVVENHHCRAKTTNSGELVPLVLSMPRL